MCVCACVCVCVCVCVCAALYVLCTPSTHPAHAIRTSSQAEAGKLGERINRYKGLGVKVNDIDDERTKVCLFGVCVCACERVVYMFVCLLALFGLFACLFV